MPVRALLQCLIMRLPRNMLIVKKCSKKMQFQVPNVISNVLAEGKLPNPSATTEFLKIQAQKLPTESCFCSSVGANT